MIYIEQDFYLNFTNAVKSNDDNALRNMLSDEISRLISERTQLTDLLKKLSIVITDKPTNEELSNVITSNITNDNKLRVGLAYLIAKNNDIVLNKKTEKQEKESKEEKEENSKKANTDTVALISTSISTLIKSIGKNIEDFKNEIILKSNNKAPNLSEFSLSKQEQLLKEKQPVKEEEEKTPKKNKKWLWILLGIAVVGGGIYLAHKKGWIKFGKGDGNSDLGAGNVDLSDANLGDISLENIPSSTINNNL
jgi:hypothetical protein